MTQSRRMSFVESLANVAIGYGVAVASQVLIFPLFGIHVPLRSNLLIGLWFTVISIGRSYLLRRLFNRSRCRHVFTNPLTVSGYGLTEYEVWFCERCPETFGRQTKNFNHL